MEDGLHGVGLRFETGARGDSEEAILGIDGSQLASLIKFHPGNVVTNQGLIQDFLKGGGWGKVKYSSDDHTHPTPAMPVGAPSTVHHRHSRDPSPLL